MVELGKWLISLDGSEVSVVGLLLAFIIIAGWSFINEKVVTGVRWKQKLSDEAALKELIKAQDTELKATREQNSTFREEIARLTEREKIWVQSQARLPQ